MLRSNSCAGHRHILHCLLLEQLHAIAHSTPCAHQWPCLCVQGATLQKGRQAVTSYRISSVRHLLIRSQSAPYHVWHVRSADSCEAEAGHVEEDDGSDAWWRSSFVRAGRLGSQAQAQAAAAALAGATKPQVRVCSYIAPQQLSTCTCRTDYIAMEL